MHYLIYKKKSTRFCPKLRIYNVQYVLLPKHHLWKKKNRSSFYALHSEAIENDVILTQRVGKCTMLSDIDRQSFMTLQGETNVAAAHVSKVVILERKFLFN